MRCGRCGNENAEANRFCGMCGAPLVAKEQTVPPPVSREAEPRTAPAITGPSFLGLNTPAPEKESRRGGAKEDRVADRHDPLRPSPNVDYLLEDDDEPRRGWGKLILIVVALALAVGFGYLHWKRGGFDWLTAGNKKPTAATAQAPQATQSGADSGTAASAPAGSAAPQQAGSGTAPVAGGAASPAESSAPPTAPPTSSQNTTPQNAPAQTTSPQSTSTQSAAPGAPAETAASPSATPQSAPASNPGDSGAAAAESQGAESESEKQSPAAETTQKAIARKPAVRKPAVTKPAAAKPNPAKAAAAKAVDSVTEAERYIYGRGAEQDCDRGLRLLKPAAEQSNVKAMVSMGVLYSTGTCTPRDLPTAYRWFALALHKEPDNQALQDDLQSLWGKMTPPERQLAIKLSQ